tara:strand:- start:3852 stop:4715 length:864 start_codon:yes stop_codon:yes gene_type:complete
MIIRLYIILAVIFSFNFANTIYRIPGNTEQFSSMNTGSFIDSYHRKINHKTYPLYSMSFIHFPAEIKFHQLFFQKPIKNYLISSHINILNYGTLEDVFNHQFSAYEQKLGIALFNILPNNLTYGLSIEYCRSKIEAYTSSALNYNIGFKKIYLDNRFSIGLSLENYNNWMQSYSNLQDSLASTITMSTSYKPKFLPLNLIMNYSNHNNDESELVVGCIGNINNRFYFYSGKYFYFNNLSVYSTLNNVAFGLGIFINNQYKIDFGIQHLTDGIFNIGTSLTVITLDNL